MDKRRKDRMIVVSQRMYDLLIWLGRGRPSNMHGRPGRAKGPQAPPGECPCGVCASDKQDAAQ